MRVFWAVLEGRTDANWSLNGLPNAGRMDEAARIVNTAIWLSHDIRRDVVLYLTFYGPPKPPRTVKFVSSELKKTSPDERSVAAVIKKALAIESAEDWERAHWGVYVRDVGAELAEEIDLPIVVLDERGEQARELPEDACYVIGGPHGFPADFRVPSDARRISIGDKIYTASFTVAAVNFLLDGGCR